MSKDQEPSMNDILDSIRTVLDDDGIKKVSNEDELELTLDTIVDDLAEEPSIEESFFSFKDPGEDEKGIFEEEIKAKLGATTKEDLRELLNKHVDNFQKLYPDITLGATVAPMNELDALRLHNSLVLEAGLDSLVEEIPEHLLRQEEEEKVQKAKQAEEAKKAKQAEEHVQEELEEKREQSTGEVVKPGAFAQKAGGGTGGQSLPNEISSKDNTKGHDSLATSGSKSAGMTPLIGNSVEGESKKLGSSQDESGQNTQENREGAAAQGASQQDHVKRELESLQKAKEKLEEEANVQKEQVKRALDSLNKEKEKLESEALQQAQEKSAEARAQANREVEALQKAKERLEEESASQKAQAKRELEELQKAKEKLEEESASQKAQAKRELDELQRAKEIFEARVLQQAQEKLTDRKESKEQTKTEAHSMQKGRGEAMTGKHSMQEQSSDPEGSLVEKEIIESTANIFKEASRSIFDSLAQPKMPQGSDNVLEQVIMKALQPLLKEWLDDNLERITRSAIEKEVSRITSYLKYR